MKVGRNDPCACGSGRKFKKCCMNLTGSPGTRSDLAPSELVLARREAFDRGDFAYIYDTYHPDSMFRQQFPDRQEYLRYGASSLAADYRILECRILREEIAEDAARVLFLLASEYGGQRVESLELSRFLRTGKGWRYHSSQKMTRDEYPGKIEDIGWDDFDRGKDKVFF
ncbi:MAG: hypothetical protein C0617_05520 [Desulfuromonas sp.]|uniref:YchJ family metal-binding protein n=1 Tax=Desulfuromonas sp. TaxID=892 RepID=UPI000CC9E940|nr:YchJ family metal-binding protein [Desulfuromonas sp.]PLX85143.1 MAG: hypothetical protein C0617_05520 [Desulfuromonas sp.]